VDEFARAIHTISDALAKRTGRPEDDLAVRTVAGALVGVMMAITLPTWEGPEPLQPVTEWLERVDEALALLEAGMPL
jgi:hypothetical protein